MKELQLQAVSVAFGSVRALNDVHVDVAAGGTLMLVGPNGAGKSTLIKVVLGLVRPNAGSVVIDGQPCRVDNRLKERMGYLPEAVAFAQNLSGKQVLSFFARARGMPRSSIGTALERVGLTAAASRAVGGYSRGMRQRLGLAVALLAEPPLLILDEPTGGLDQEGLSVLWSVLDEWRERERIVVISTHDLALLERHVSKVCVLNRGRVITQGAPTELRRRTDLPDRVLFELSEDHDASSSFLQALDSFSSVSVEHHLGRELSVTLQPKDMLALLDLRGRFPEAVSKIRIQEPGLNAVYDHLVMGDV